MRSTAVIGAILAGGRSQRMGSDKGLLPFGGRRLIQVVLDTLQPLFPEVVIVANDPVAYGGFRVPVVPDRIPDKGPLGGIHAALSVARSPHIFCVACDMPFVNPTVVTHLCALAPGFDAVVPQSGAGYEPLHAVYSRSCLPHVERMVREDRLRAEELLAVVRVRRVDTEELRSLDPSLRSFLNVNTPEELQAARRLFDQEGKAGCAS